MDTYVVEGGKLAWWEQWNAALGEAIYGKESGQEADVTMAAVTVNSHGGVSWYLRDETTKLWWSCYYNALAGDPCCDGLTDPNLRYEAWEWWTGIDRDMMPEQGCPCEACQVRLDADAYMDSMWGATDWENWEWESYDYLPDVF